MNKLAIKVVSGDFERGFPIILRQGENLEIEGNLPAAPNLPQDYETWKSNYHNHPGIHHFRAIKPIPVQVTNYSHSDLKNSINTWLNSAEPEFRPLRDKILASIAQNDQKEIILQTEDVWFWHIPWHLWDVLEENKIEVILSASQYEKLPQVRKIKPKDEVKILVILGDSTNIDVKSDLLLLQNQLPHAYIQPLLQPSKEQLRNKLWEQEWDILFFAGHSYSQGGNVPGEFQINPQEKLTIEELKHGLENAIKNGLQLAIFNSCDCIGLARELVKLQLPATIVMREPVLDIVAQKFLEHFLKAFAKRDKTLSASVREARERLREIEDKYFCASMLPLICHNPATEMPTWRSLLGHSNQVEYNQEQGKKQIIQSTQIDNIEFLPTTFKANLKANFWSVANLSGVIITCLLSFLSLISLKANQIQYKDTPIKSNSEVKFICADDGESSSYQVPTTYASTPEGKFPIIRWETNYLNSSGWIPQRRCEEISLRLQSAYDNGSMKFITNGKINDQPVICTTREYGGECADLLFTLRPEDDTIAIAEQLADTFKGRAVGGLRQSSSDRQYYIEVNIDQLLIEAQFARE
ncbi:MAG: CHAT domain-containing protein [Kamptonema sp. SIO1D9]|nr:CHAT domain-containing protein [Kamptonema sp. SIO1D9]